MALKQGSARESAKKKSSNQSSGNKLPPDRKASRIAAPPVNREPRATANRDHGRAGELEGSALSPARGKRRLASRPAAGKGGKWDTHARRKDDIDLPPREDIS